MLAAKFRFHGYAALKFLFGHGKTFRFKSMSLRVAPNNRRTHSRAAIVISKKVIKASPKRNRVRRRMYEILRTHWGHIKEGHDILVTVYDAGVWDMPHETLEHEVLDALHKSDLWLQEPHNIDKTT